MTYLFCHLSTLLVDLCMSRLTPLLTQTSKVFKEHVVPGQRNDRIHLVIWKHVSGSLIRHWKVVDSSHTRITSFFPGQVLFVFVFVFTFVFLYVFVFVFVFVFHSFLVSIRRGLGNKSARLMSISRRC